MNPIERYDVKGKFPVKLGSALRNPAYSYEFWGIRGDEEILRVYSDRAYHTEWEEGSPRQMEYVIEAAKTAGLGNCSGMLRDLQALTIFHILNLPRFRDLRRVNYTEPGAGASTVVLYKFLTTNDYDIGRLFSTLVEPSEKRLYAAVGELEELGLKEGEHFVPIVGKDSELSVYLEPGSQHIVAANATLHHHAYQDRVFGLMFELLANGGFFGNFDWYEGLCEHPARVFRALRDHKFKTPIKWETKDEDLTRYVDRFPRALNRVYPVFSPEDEMAARMITTFWLDGWAVARARAFQYATFDPRDDYFLHEAHGRPGPQVELLKAAGFRIDTGDIQTVTEAAEYNGNPHQVLTKEEMLRLNMQELYKDIPEKGSNLLMGTLMQKKV